MLTVGMLAVEILLFVAAMLAGWFTTGDDCAQFPLETGHFVGRCNRWKGCAMSKNYLSRDITEDKTGSIEYLHIAPNEMDLSHE